MDEVDPAEARKARQLQVLQELTEIGMEIGKSVV